ncbi:MAG: CRISPR-associated endonuclease Cas1 [Kamptonema sp. SIO4C4]|nr:CRISPR-associated endonuclease Cas1 [Kamptonema sp. SIO4C4]
MSILYLTQPNSFLTTDGREFAVVQEDCILSRVPLEQIQQVVAFEGGEFSKLAVRTAQRYGIPLIFIADHGRTIARFEPPTEALYLAQQYQFSHQPEFYLPLAQSLLRGRWHNGVTILLQLYARHTSDALHQAIAQLKADLETLPGLSSLAAVRVWAQRVTQFYRNSWRFFCAQQGAVNWSIEEGYSMAYALLSQELYALLREAGCSPHVGTLHPDCQNHLPLPCDLMEQFRPLVERWVWQNWSPVHSGCSLDQWEGFLQHSVTHPYGEVMSLRS